MKKQLFRSLVIIAVAGLCSCLADVDLTKMDPSMKFQFGAALPVGEVSATIGDFLGGDSTTQDMLYVREDGVLCIRVDSIEEVAEIEDVDLTEGMEPVKNELTIAGRLPYELPAGVGMLVGTGNPIEVTFDIGLSLGDINKAGSKNRVDSVILSKAEFTAKFQANNFTLPFNKIESVDLLLPDEMHRSSNVVPIDLEGKDYGQNISIVIDNFVLDLINDPTIGAADGNVKDSITLQMHMIFSLESGESVMVYSNSGFNFEIGISKLDYKAVFGYFEPDGLGQAETMNMNLSDMLPIWDKLLSFRVPFANPLIDLAVTTNVGAPINLHINHFKAIDKNKTDVAYALFNGSRSTDIELENKVRPTDPLEATAKNEIQFSNDPAKGHIDTLFSVEPEELEFSYTASLLKKTDYPQFRIPAKASVKVEGTMTLPMEFKEGLNLALSDTIHDVKLTALDLDSLAESAEVLDSLNVNRLKLVLIVNNGIPFDVNANLRAINEKGQPMDLGIEDLRNLSLKALQETNVVIDLSDEQIDMLPQVKQIIYTFALVDDPSAGLTYPVAFNTDSKLTIKMAVAANAEAYLKLGKGNNSNN